jgi:hypothetical protein
VTKTLPEIVQSVFDRFITTEYTTIDSRGQPITWPVTPYYAPGHECIDVTTGLGYPKKADDAARNPYVSLLFSDPTGSGLDGAPMVLVQGVADVDDRDLDANRDRYWVESAVKLPATKDLHPPAFVRKSLSWYYTRIYVHVRPERVYVWPGGDATSEPELLDSHLDEVRSGHDEEPIGRQAPPSGEGAVWDSRLDVLGTQPYATAVLSLVAPDGFPFSVRLPVQPDEAAGCIRFGGDALGVPVTPGLACLSAHAHAPEFSWQNNFQVRGDYVERDGEWVLVPHKFVGGFVVPEGRAAMLRENFRKSMRFRKVAKRELAKRTASRG